MTIKVTAKDLLNKGQWRIYAFTKLDRESIKYPYNEKEEFNLTIDEAYAYGFLKVDKTPLSKKELFLQELIPLLKKYEVTILDCNNESYFSFEDTCNLTTLSEVKEMLEKE